MSIFPIRNSFILDHYLINKYLYKILIVNQENNQYQYAVFQIKQ